MTPLLPLLLLAPPALPHNDVEGDAYAAARAIAAREIADARRHVPHAQIRLLASGGALGRADLLLPGPPLPGDED